MSEEVGLQPHHRAESPPGTKSFPTSFSRYFWSDMTKFFLLLNLLFNDNSVRCVPDVPVEFRASRDSLVVILEEEVVYRLGLIRAVDLADRFDDSTQARHYAARSFTLRPEFYLDAYLMTDGRAEYLVQGGFTDHGFLLFITSLRTKLGTTFSNYPCKP